MTILDFPVQKASNITRTLRASVAAVGSPFTGGQQVQDWGGEWWEYQIDMAVLRAVDGRSLSAFLAQLGGQRGRFLFRDPTIRNTASVGEPVVSGAGQTGNALVTSGWYLALGRRNLLTYSEQFDNAEWGKSRATVTANATVAPDGTTTADKLAEDTTSSQSHYVNTQYVACDELPTISVFLKAAERTSANLQVVKDGGTAGASPLASIDLVAGTTNNGTITSVGNGWFRVSIKATSAGANYAMRVHITNPIGVTTYTGDGTSGIYIWGAQLEAGKLTAYQPIPSPVMYAGEFISIGTGADTRLHQLTADVTPDNSGNATLQIVPRLRPSPADGAVIETANPAVLLRATGPVPTAIDAVHHYRVSLNAREAL